MFLLEFCKYIQLCLCTYNCFLYFFIEFYSSDFLFYLTIIQLFSILSYFILCLLLETYLFSKERQKSKVNLYT